LEEITAVFKPHIIEDKIDKTQKITIINLKIIKEISNQSTIFEEIKYKIKDLKQLQPYQAKTLELILIFIKLTLINRILIKLLKIIINMAQLLIMHLSTVSLQL
jgi:hypothetical protein